MKNCDYLKISILALLMSVSAFTAEGYAQVTIGSNEAPQAGALLDLHENETTKESTKGFLLPRVVLLGPNLAFPLLSHVEGMVVYNEAASDTLGVGLYKNDGRRWQPMQLPKGQKEGQFLVMDRATMTPQWVTKFFPTSFEASQYSLTKTEAFKYKSSYVFPGNENYGGTEYDQDDPIDNGYPSYPNNTGWHQIIPEITIDVNEDDNKIIIFLQTTLFQHYYASGGYLSYAGGIFLNGDLQGVRMSTINSTSTNTQDAVSKSETLFFVLEDLPAGENTIQIAFKRRTHSSTAVGDLYVGGDMTWNSKTYPGSTSVSYEFYEKKTN